MAYDVSLTLKSTAKSEEAAIQDFVDAISNGEYPLEWIVVKRRSKKKKK